MVAAQILPDRIISALDFFFLFYFRISGRHACHFALPSLFSDLYALQNQQDELAGALMVLAFFRWEVGLFLTLIIWRVYYEKRSHVFYGFGMLIVVLLTISFLMNPSWVIPYLQSSLADLRADYGFTSIAILLRLWPTFNTHFIWIIPVSLIFYWALNGTPLVGATFITLFGHAV